MSALELLVSAIAERVTPRTERVMPKRKRTRTQAHTDAAHAGIPAPGGKVTLKNYREIRANFSDAEFKRYRYYMGKRTGAVNEMEAVSLVLVDVAAAKRFSPVD